ncbi:hypothetical protein N7493_008858 [Penicillium malachiteum]|uniref:Mid2 domain-containing protein n=1 Tax=Penicillium malachiteum TaxID=1324776 RepID=A0AAD6HFS3_9EURO|nr:hypothetical protein N7493_008858 [Penicillium malachiteum]
MQALLLLLLGAQLTGVTAHPYATKDVSLAAQTSEPASNFLGIDTDKLLRVFEFRDIEERDVIVARATTTDSTTSTTSTSTTSTSTSTTSTTSSTTTSSTTSTTSTSTTSSTTSTTTTTSSSSASSSASTTTSASTKTTTSATTTTTTAAATTTSSSSTSERDRRGNIAAIIFVCCLVSVFAGVAFLHCYKERALSKRIAARELLKATAMPSEVVPPTRNESSTNLLGDRSSVMLGDNVDSRAPTAQSNPVNREHDLGTY